MAETRRRMKVGGARNFFAKRPIEAAMKRSDQTDERTGDRQQAAGNAECLSGPAFNGLRKGSDIALRLLKMSAGAYRIARLVPRDLGSRHIATQLVRAASAAGANYEEARAAESRGDFVHKCAIAAKELRETTYWLAFLAAARVIDADVSALIREGNELTAILVASIRTARKGGSE